MGTTLQEKLQPATDTPRKHELHLRKVSAEELEQWRISVYPYLM